jgi:release factor glutamine methyltransferase
VTADRFRLRGVVLPGVFHPRSDSWLLARAATRQGLAPGARVLELCAGPAFAGLAGARAAHGHLTTVDVSRRAQLNAWLNGRLNGVPVRALRGDLLAPVAGERFDLILANPPYVPGPPPPARGAARAWDAGPDGRAVLDRILAEAPSHLAPGGTLLLVHSDIIGADATLHAYSARGLRADVAERERGPLGPLVSERREALEQQGLLRAGQDDEDVLVLRGRAAA